MKAKRRKPDAKVALRIVRAQLRERRAMGGFGRYAVADQPKAGPPQFIQLIEVKRGMSGFLHALDSEGQVWERQWRKATETTKEESWWEALTMERRRPAPGAEKQEGA